jgi:ATP-dependent Zn protease
MQDLTQARLPGSLTPVRCSADIRPVATQPLVDRSPLGTFFRGALFPLIVVVLLVFLAQQTFMGESTETSTLPYSQLVDRVRANPAAVGEVVFRPDRHEVKAELVSGEDLRAGYPTPRSQVELENFLAKNGVTYDFDWSTRGESAWWSIVTALLPFVLLFGFWVFLTNRRPSPPD